ncbi:MAG TPA: hypothetical protein VFB38_23865 [Chthonomonadaceae bacterium]|nr:hypothetical protein [Chthonomonadaceae bacterium]
MKRAGKRIALAVGALAVAAALLPRPAGAEHFDILLRVQSPQGQAETFMDTTPPIGGLNPRPVVKARVGDILRIAWRMKSAFPHGTMKNVTIHFFIVREQQLGQKPVPDPAGPAGVVDNSFVMDFAPDAAATGALRYKVTEPGDYLIRVQSENTHEEHEHEHFSAIDLHVE